MNIPFLLVHGTKDQYIPIEHAHRLFASLKCTKEFFVVQEARHGFRSGEQKQQVIDAALHWFEKYGRP